MKIRIALAIDPTGAWNAVGWGGEVMWNDQVTDNTRDEAEMSMAVDGVGDGEARYWIDVEVEIPKVGKLDATVTLADEEQE